MAVTIVGKKINMTAATDEVTFPVVVKTIRWTGAGAAADELSLVESSVGTITNELYQSVAAGANNVEESLKELLVSPFGIRVGVLDSGEVDIYFK